MLKDVMVRLDGTAADEVRLAAVNDIADLFDSQVIGLLFSITLLPRSQRRRASVRLERPRRRCTTVRALDVGTRRKAVCQAGLRAAATASRG